MIHRTVIFFVGGVRFHFARASSGWILLRVGQSVPCSDGQRDTLMPKYLFIYRGGRAGKQLTPEEIQAMMNKWGAWIGKFMASGHMVDGGDGLLPGGKVVKPGGLVSDGPFPETKELVGGYSIIKAKDYDEAVSVAVSCPVFENGGHIEIRELAGYGDQLPH